LGASYSRRVFSVFILKSFQKKLILAAGLLTGRSTPERREHNSEIKTT
jgi:hypothetical protein